MEKWTGRKIKWFIYFLSTNCRKYCIYYCEIAHATSELSICMFTILAPRGNIIVQRNAINHKQNNNTVT